MSRISHRAPSAIACALGLVLAGCGPAGPDPDLAARAGSHTLVRAAGEPLPAVVSDSERATVQVLAGSAELRDDGTCTFETGYRFTSASGTRENSTPERCTWEVEGDRATFRFESREEPNRGVFGPDDELRLPADVEFVYRPVDPGEA